MKISKVILGVILFVFIGNFILANDIVRKVQCAHEDHVDFSSVISCYREKIVGLPLNYSFVSKETLTQVELYHYHMISQSWSPDHMVHPDQWQHNVDIYIPKYPKKQYSVMVVNNGTNYAETTKVNKPTDFSEQTLAEIAHATNTVVISVSNIPNQYLTFFHDQSLFKEDFSVARSWILFMDKPEQRKLMPLHIPMTIAVSQAMRLAKQELKKWNIDKFIVTGASKRGWITWLSAISDPDVVAIVPFVIDLLSMDVALEHMYSSYGGNWPIAFFPYYQQGVDQLIKTPNFIKLMKIEDPLKYIGLNDQSKVNIPKYIINASGDDFYVPDNSRFYYDQLPGIKSFRMVPNSDHHGILKFAQQSLITFINRFQHNRSLPELVANFDMKQGEKIITVSFSEIPVKITLWTAKNLVARDFRYACGIRYTASPLEVSAEGKVEILLSSPTVGWEATYIEATFDDNYVATTQVYITPNKYPMVAPPKNSTACQTLSGRGLGEK